MRLCTALQENRRLCGREHSHSAHCDTRPMISAYLSVLRAATHMNGFKVYDMFTVVLL